MIEPGKYWGDLLSIETGESGENKTPCISLRFQIEGQEDEQGGSLVRTVYLFLTDAAWEFTAKKLESIGFNGDFAEPAVETERVLLACRIEEWNGKDRDRWDFANWGSGMENLETDTVRDLNAKWKNDHPTAAGKPKDKPKGKGKGKGKKDKPKSDGKTPRQRAWDRLLECNEKLDPETDRNKLVEVWAGYIEDVRKELGPEAPEEEDFGVREWGFVHDAIVPF